MTNYQKIIYYIEHKMLNRAFGELRTWMANSKSVALADRLDDLQTNYRLLLDYFVRNVADPQRKTVYNGLLADLYELADRLNADVQARDSLLFEYVQMRLLRPGNMIPAELWRNLADYYDGVAPRHIYEATLGQLFDMLWLSDTYSDEMRAFYLDLIAHGHLGDNEKSLAVTALTLNLWRRFAEDKMLLLVDSCLEVDENVSGRALVGLCFLCAKYDSRLSLYPEIGRRIDLLLECSDIANSLKTIVLQIIRSAQTEEISQRLRTEIIPEMLKANPRLREKMENESFLKIEDIEDPNPEWADFLEESGIGKKLRELTELQMEGADVYMGTFSALRSLPFFEQTSHWFMLFDKDFSEIAPLFASTGKTLLSSFVSGHVLCNSDKYAFCYALRQMPDAQQESMQRSLNAELEQLGEQMDEQQKVGKSAVQLTNQYLQDLYRFFKLHRRRNDMDDMFAFALSLHQKRFFKRFFPNPADVLEVANFYFAKKHYTQALELFRTLENDFPTPEMYQKIGYANQQLGNLDGAMQAYGRADLLAPDHVWTLKRMAFCARLQGNIDDALRYYSAVVRLKPNDKKVWLNIGLCHLELKQYGEALNLYYKLDIDHPDDVQVWRALAWCLFIMRNYAQAAKYWDKVLAGKPTAEDCMNAAHNLFCMGRREEAIAQYRRSKAATLKASDFRRSFMRDADTLQEQGMDADEIALLFDCI